MTDLETQLERSVNLVQQQKERQRMSGKAIVKQQQEQAPELTQWELMREQAATLVSSGFLPRTVNTPEKAMAIIQTGKELGLAPMQSLRSIHIIEGKPTLSADLIAGLALARVPGSVLRVAETTEKVCVVQAARAGQELTTFRYSWEDAQRAGLVGKQNWKNYPRAMLRARCLTEATRAIFPDVVAGIFDPDELGAVTTATGEVIEVQPFREERDDRLALSPHADSREEAAGDEDLFADLLHKLEAVKSELPHCDSYDRTLALRGIIGTKAKQSDLTKRIQAGGESGHLTTDMRKELGKLWMHCDRQVSKLEEKLKPALEASFSDEPAAEEPMREPGDDSEDLL